MSIRRLALLLALGLAGCAPPAPPTLSAVSTITLEGEGEVRRAPVSATVQVGVEARASTGAEAMRLQAERTAKVVEALRAAGVTDADMQTTNLSLQPSVSWINKMRVRTFIASNNVQAEVRNLPKLGETLDAVIAAGGLIDYGLAFNIEEDGGADAQAREAAIRDAVSKADRYAAALGYRVKRVVSLSEPGVTPPAPVYELGRLAPQNAPTEVAAEASSPILPGQVAAVARVHLTVEIEKAPEPAG
jgi:uncharacterized protein